ncbi:hypothetical protein Fcan01_02396 [Folsomia candida]|uniref:Alpha-1,3-glucosyltransferase n=1 Tax=Folsomia candida TaxID=158441 RepID=A0A226F0P4_FOLCA|nr:hypothetical protein Fcan01_02396 [Folsomia candida]
MTITGETRSFWTCVLLVSVVKLLMLKSYRSTDFEVHRNWLAITHSLPLEKWYYESTSEWTLDYPPLFAYFEWILSYGALVFDPKMLDVQNLNYASPMTILYQKLTVIVTDVILAYGVLECSKVMSLIIPKTGTNPKSNYATELFGLIFINGGLFMVDHIHFQYNGFLFGILMLSIARISKGKCFQGAFLFASLLSLKHIFLYIAPAIGIYLLRTCCITTDRRGVPRAINFGPLFAFGGLLGAWLQLLLDHFISTFPKFCNGCFRLNVDFLMPTGHLISGLAITLWISYLDMVSRNEPLVS